MDNRVLAENLARLGMPFLEATEDVDVTETIADVIKSHDRRFWEGFPVLLANVARKRDISLPEISAKLNNSQQEAFQKLLILTLALFAANHLSYTWSEKLKKSLSSDQKELLSSWRNSIVHNVPIKWEEEEFDPQRLMKYFALYLADTSQKDKERQQRLEGLSLEYAQSQIFSPRQKEIFNRKLQGGSLTKTEQEYYSRTIKKKVMALANPELHTLAKRLLEQA